MDYRTAEQIWKGIESTRLVSLRIDLIRAALSYSNHRVQWMLALQEQRSEMDAARSRAHNAFIDTCNILSRNMAAGGESIEWRRLLGDDRKEIGDIACYIILFLGLAAR